MHYHKVGTSNGKTLCLCVMQIEMHIRQKNIHRLSAYGIGLQVGIAYLALVTSGAGNLT